MLVAKKNKPADKSLQKHKRFAKHAEKSNVTKLVHMATGWEMSAQEALKVNFLEQEQEQ